MADVTLTLDVIGPEADKLGPGARKVFNTAGGTIGRLPDNAWVLPDPYVSSRHAVIGFQDGRFYIEDISTNGVYINSQDNAVAQRQRHPLKAGDWIFIDPYEIRASMSGDPVAASPFADPFSPAASPGAPPAGAPRRPPPTFSPVRSQGPGVPPSGPAPGLPIDLFGAGDDPSQLDPLALLGGAPRPPEMPRAPVPPARDDGPAWGEAYQPPTAVPPAVHDERPGGGIPENWMEDAPAAAPEPASPPSNTGLHPVAPPPAAPVAAAARPTPSVPRRVLPARSPAPAREAPPRETLPREALSPETLPPAMEAPAPGASAGPHADLAAVLAGAGLGHTEISDELADELGHILRTVVNGVMDMLRARQQTKAALRLDQTMFRPRDNNPLKFSANVDDALHNLFVKRNPAFLQPVEAFEDAFDDVRHHQMAMLHGMRVAFETMLGQFDPDRLQEQFDRQVKKGALVAIPAKLRYWELYRDRMQEMIADADASFRELFGDEFASAYEEQLKRLKSQGRGGTS